MEGGDFNDFDDSEEHEYVPKLSKLEEEYMEAARKRHKENMTKPQVVHGKEFKGTAFISKPDVIFFKDFDLGKTHVQTILLTNVSFSFNSFKLLPLEDSIKDFFDIKYTPSGRMSAGLSTTIQITFVPQLNQDINSILPLLAETGPINIPLICTCKKALLKVEEPIIDFGDVIFGEEATKNLKIDNDGALPAIIYIKTNKGEIIPVMSEEDLDIKRKNEKQKKIEEEVYRQRKIIEEQQRAKNPEGDPNQPPQEESKEPKPITQEEIDAALEKLTFEENEFDEFCVQAIFKRENNIGSYTSKNLSFIFKPIKLGRIFQECTLYFDNQDYTSPIPIIIKGQCVDVPIYVEKLTYNLHILVYEKTYREKIVLFNRSPNTMKLQLYFPKELKTYLEFNPTLGYIQGKDKFEIWMKLKPDRTILSVGKKYITEGNNITIPIKVVGANQVIPVRFNIIGRFTVNAITFTPPSIDFGNVFHSSASRVNMMMENHSLLPQQFFFANLPREINVETDNGCGIVLPGESYKFCIVYRPSQITVYEEGEVFCRIVTGNICSREVKINYKVNVVKLPLKVSHSLIEFPGLPEKEIVEFVTQIENPTQKTFMVELIPPKQKLSGIMITPVVMQIPPQKSNLVSIKFKAEFREFSAQILEKMKKDEEQARRDREVQGIIKKDGEDQAKEEDQEDKLTKRKKRRNKKLAERLKQQQDNPDEAVGDPNKKKAAPPPAKKEEEKKDAGKKGKKDDQAEKEEEEQKKREEQEKIEQERRRIEEMEKNFDNVEELRKLGGKKLDFFIDDPKRRSQHYDWTIPMFFRDTSKPENAELKRSFLEVRTITLARSLVPNEEVVDFGEVPVAFRKTHEILIKNIGDTEQALKMEALTPYGGFAVLNARRTLAPGDTKPILVEFNPFTQQIYEERLKLYSDTTVTSVLLKGIGVRPEVRIEPQDGLIYFANLLVNEQAEKEFVIKNISLFPVKFSLIRKAEGIVNKKGLSNFTFIPSEGIVPSSSSLKVKIIFNPDRVSNHYFQILKLEVPNQVKEQMIYVRGFSYRRQVFAREEDPFIWREIEVYKARQYEELLSLREDKDETKLADDPDQLKKLRTILLEFVRSDDPDSLTEEEREKMSIRKVLIGSCKLADNKLEKGGAYEFVAPPDDKYFECDIPKGNVVAGQETIVKFKFKPPEIDPLLKEIKEVRSIGRWVESTWECKITGGFVEAGQPDLLIYQIKLRAYAQQI